MAEAHITSVCSLAWVIVLNQKTSGSKFHCMKAGYKLYKTQKEQYRSSQQAVANCTQRSQAVPEVTHGKNHRKHETDRPLNLRVRQERNDVTQKKTQNTSMVSYSGLMCIPLMVQLRDTTHQNTNKRMFIDPFGLFRVTPLTCATGSRAPRSRGFHTVW